MVRMVMSLALFLGLMNAAMAASFSEGTHYRVLDNPGSTNNSNKIEVREFFSYGCPACASIEAPLHDWVDNHAADDIDFVRNPVLFLRNAEPLARAYYVMEALDMKEDMHQAVFDAIHVHRENLFSPQALARFFAKFGVEESEFNRLYNSFGVNTKIRQADALSRDYQIPGVPNFVVNGKYVVLRENLSTLDELFAVIEYLAEKERS